MKKSIALLIYVLVLLAIIASVLFSTINGLASKLNISPADLIKPLPKKFADKKELNFLVLGIGGGSHEGPNLTDSITIAKLDLASNTLHTVGLPRDIWHMDIKDKINSIYAYSQNEEHNKESLAYTKRHFESILGMELHSVVVIDFKTFVSVIDAIGGVTISLNKGFIDPEFPKKGFENAECTPYDPNYGCRYVSLTFPKGTYTINGIVALDFVRSRHAEGDAGSDFSRSARQQLIISAIKEKLTGLIEKRDLNRIAKFVTILDRDIYRDFTNADIIPLLREVTLNSTKLSIASHTFDSEYFEVPDFAEYDGRYVLIPPKGDYESFQNDIKKMLQEK